MGRIIYSALSILFLYAAGSATIKTDQRIKKIDLRSSAKKNLFEWELNKEPLIIPNDSTSTIILSEELITTDNRSIILLREYEYRGTITYATEDCRLEALAFYEPRTDDTIFLGNITNKGDFGLEVIVRINPTGRCISAKEPTKTEKTLWELYSPELQKNK
jgi:hypothetical protein